MSIGSILRTTKNPDQHLYITNVFCYLNGSIESKRFLFMLLLLPFCSCVATMKNAASQFAVAVTIEHFLSSCVWVWVYFCCRNGRCLHFDIAIWFIVYTNLFVYEMLFVSTLNAFIEKFDDDDGGDKTRHWMSKI